MRYIENMGIVFLLILSCFADSPKSTLFVESSGEFFLSLQFPGNKEGADISIDGLGHFSVESWPSTGLFYEGHVETRFH